ncbi:MAG: hypothetical protein ACJ8A0_18300 [Microvirga sp.]|jgi:hypothetical protein
MFGRKKAPAKAGLVGPNGQNLLPMTPAQFDTFMNNLCGTGAAKDEAIGKIKAAIDDARQLQEFNAIPTTNPKYYSIPMISLDRHCNVNVDWKPASDDEEPNPVLNDS